MKKLFLLISLFTTSLHVAAECSYSGTGGGINVSFTNVKILSDSSQPNGAILAAATRGGNVTDVKTFSNCDPSDVYVIHSTKDVDSGIKGVQGMPVYNTGIPGIGYQITDITIGTKIRPIAAEFNSPVPADTRYFSKSYIPEQVTVWLVKTGPITPQTLSGMITVYYLAGNATDTAGTGAQNKGQLFRIGINLSTIKFKQTSCNITPRNGNTVILDKITAAQLKATPQGGDTGKQKNIRLDIDCPSTEVGKNYLYWFNPISENSPTKDGVLLNDISSGVRGVGLIIKQENKPITFYDLNKYKISNIKNNQSLNLTADYYLMSNDVTSGAVKGQFEVILQEK